MKILPLFLLIGSAFAQTPCAAVPPVANTVPIASENVTILSVSPATVVATVQYGAGTTWSPAVTLLKFPQSASNYNLIIAPCGDPAPGIGKSLVAQRGTVAYSITWTYGTGSPTTTPVPALPVVAPPVVIPAKMLLGTFFCTVQMYSDMTFQTTNANCAPVKQ